MAVVSAAPAEEKRRERACTRERGEDRGERKATGGGSYPLAGARRRWPSLRWIDDESEDTELLPVERRRQKHFVKIPLGFGVFFRKH
jgi:hypothetical protein